MNLQNKKWNRICLIECPLNNGLPIPKWVPIALVVVPTVCPPPSMDMKLVAKVISWSIDGGQKIHPLELFRRNSLYSLDVY